MLAGPRVRDRWQVLGQVDSDDGALMSRRIWLRGADTGRFALLLSFAAPGQTLQSDVLPGTEMDADLCFYPGAYPMRALVAERYGTPLPLTAPAGAVPLREALGGWAVGAGRRAVAARRAGAAGRRGAGRLGLADVCRPGTPCRWRPAIGSRGGCWPRPAPSRRWWRPSGPRPACARWPPGPAAATSRRRCRCRTAARARAPELPADLLAAALVGTARRPWTANEVRVGDRAVPTAGATLLEAAAIAVTYRRAGMTPSAGQPPVPAAPAEVDRPLPAAAGARLRRILSDGGTPGGAQVASELLAQWLALAAGHGGHVPPETLPDLLDAGRRNGAIRAALGRVAGRRGAWLAAMRDDWRWLLDEAPAGRPEHWETGSGGERLAYLIHLRATDPAAARRLLEATWAAEASEDRVRFLGALETGLSDADDEFLEQNLDDRRREVREAALDLLRQLPGSGLGRRMTERARAAVRLERRSFGRDRLIVEPPEDLDPALRRDGVAATPARGIGAGAWLLEEILASTPLEVWTPAYGRTPAAVIDLARGHDWESPLLHGWAKAAIAQRDAAWAEALVGNDARDNAAGLREAIRWDLHLVLPPAELARIAADFLRREDHLANRLLAVHPGDWPDELAVAVIETIARRARTDRHSWQLSELCRSAALSMPPRFAAPVADLAVQLDQEPADSSRVRPVAELARTLTFRHEMHLEFAG